MKIVKSLLVFVALLTSNASFSASDYICTIDRPSIADGDSGNLYEMYVKNYVGKDFTVSRNTGVMSGALKNSYVTSPKIIDIGSSENSFKVVTTMMKEEGIGNGSTVSALNVSEFNESVNKPFLYMTNDMAYFGTCVHF